VAIRGMDKLSVVKKLGIDKSPAVKGFPIWPGDFPYILFRQSVQLACIICVFSLPGKMRQKKIKFKNLIC